MARPVCFIQHILIKPLNGTKLFKVHINNCKRADYKEEHLRLNNSSLKEQLDQLNKYTNNIPDKLIVPNNAFDDEIATTPVPKH